MQIIAGTKNIKLIMLLRRGFSLPRITALLKIIPDTQRTYPSEEITPSTFPALQMKSNKFHANIIKLKPRNTNSHFRNFGQLSTILFSLSEFFQLLFILVTSHHSLPKLTRQTTKKPAAFAASFSILRPFDEGTLKTE